MVAVPSMHLPILDRMFLSRYSSDMIATVISFLFSAWCFIGQNFHTAPSLMMLSERWPGAETAFGVFALASCVFLTCGVVYQSRGFRVAGWVAGFALYFTCFYSTVHTLPSDPAAPAFLGLAVGYLWTAALVTTRVR